MRTIVKRDICKALFKEIKTQWGNGWNLLGDDLKRAVIGQRVLFLFTGLDESTLITSEKIHAHYASMLLYCGLE